MIKYSVRILSNKKIRAIWDDENSKWWYSAVDVLLALTDDMDNRNIIMTGIDYSYYYEEEE